MAWSQKFRLTSPYSIEWRIYAFRTLCIWTYDAYKLDSAKKLLKKSKFTEFDFKNGNLATLSRGD